MAGVSTDYTNCSSEEAKKKQKSSGGGFAVPTIS
jgi:hypothetical protein